MLLRRTKCESSTYSWWRNSLLVNGGRNLESLESGSESLVDGGLQKARKIGGES